MEPDVLWKREGVQLSYALPQRLSGACVYPRKPSNGSTVIICAHEEGVRVVWYGGRKIKQKQPPTVNGNSIDLTEDDEPTTIEYETDDEEVDPSKPFNEIIKYQDIVLGAAATRIATPPIGPDQNDDLTPLLNTHAIILVACSDFSLRVLAIPLEPGNDEETDLQQVIITGSSSHQDQISSVAITITASSSEEDDVRQGRPDSRSHSLAENDPNTAVPKEWSLLLASTSPIGTGLLLIHNIPLTSNGRISENAGDWVPVQRRFLRYPLVKCRIEFNPSLYPSHRHSNLLLASSDNAAVKVYQAISPVISSKRRRGSTTTIDSTTSVSQTTMKRSAVHGKVLINMLVPFSRASASILSPVRSTVLDATWALHGRAIVVLLDDGEWGVWDLEGAGPAASTASGLVQGQSAVSSIQGGSVTKFALRGNISAGNTTKNSTSTNTQSTSAASLAPMTPHTRKARSQDLFKGQSQSLPTSVSQRLQSKRGSITLTTQQNTIAGTRTQDESVIFNYGSNNVLISSLQSYWRGLNSDKGLFDGSVGSRPIILPSIRTAGEEQTIVQHLPRSSEPNSTVLFPGRNATQDILVATTSRLILFVAPLTESTSKSQPMSLPTRLLTESSVRQDQMLLDSGELDVDGMDRILNSMANSGTVLETSADAPQNHFARKSVGFQLDEDDEDMDTASPTLSKGQRNRLIINNSSTQANGARRLFT